MTLFQLAHWLKTGKKKKNQNPKSKPYVPQNISLLVNTVLSNNHGRPSHVFEGYRQRSRPAPAKAESGREGLFSRLLSQNGMSPEPFSF